MKWLPVCELIYLHNVTYFQVRYYVLWLTGPEITDELVKVLRKRLDEATLDIITVMLVRNCKLTPADVEVISLSLSYPPSLLFQVFFLFLTCSLPQFGVKQIKQIIFAFSMQRQTFVGKKGTKVS